jgi:putative ABC transport system permease protein
VRDVRDLLGVAAAGLTARKGRTFLLLLGPLIGVAAMVAAIGLTDSAKGDLKTKLAQLGTDLIVVDAAGAFGSSETPTLPEDAAQRAARLSTVDRVSAVAELSGIVTSPHRGAESYYQSFPVPVLAADAALPAVLEVGLRSGRWLDAADEATAARAAVIGSGLAREYAYLRGEIRTIRLGDTDYGVVGVLDRAELRPELDEAVFIPLATAERDFVDEPRPTRLFVRSVEGRTEETARALPTAIALGGTDEVTTTVPSDALAAQAEADKSLQRTAFMAGVLALLLGAIGIANVMSISVIQRSNEIGIRRALGHRRSTVAMQFFLEAVAVGVLGGVSGAGLGILVVTVTSALLDWTVVLQYGLIPWWVVVSIIVAAVAGLYPSVKAARLEPLETLRLG